MQDETVLLQECDFPDYFENKHHPDDFKPVREPIEKECIFHELVDHNRCILRISFRLSTDTFIPLTFICDTGAPGYIYLNNISRQILNSKIIKDDLGSLFFRINGKRMGIKPSPQPRDDTNIMGVMALRFFGFYFGGGSFGFTDMPDYL